MGLCRSEDDFIVEKLRWVVTLSNGENIYQDDDRPGETEPKAWLRLKEYTEKNNLKITNFKIQFCNHIEEAVSPNADGYYFVQRVDAVAFSDPMYSTCKYYMVGIFKDDKIYLNQWLVPEIIKVGEEVRDYKEDDIKLIR